MQKYFLRFIVFFSIFFSVMITQSFADVDPSIKKVLDKNSELKKDFDKKVVNLFTKRGKGENPAYTKGDFDGDGQQDLVALVVKKNKEYVCVFAKGLSKGKNCQPLQKSPLRYLSKIPQSDAKFKTEIQRRDLYQVEVYLGFTEAYYVNKGEIHVFDGEIH